MLKKFLLFALITLSLTGCGKPLTKEKAQEAIRKFVPTDFEVLQFSESKEIPGLYEVVISVSRQPVVFYVDKKARYVFSGSILSTDTKGNLTVETQKKFMPK